MTAYAKHIASGKEAFALSGWFGGYADLTVTWQTSSGASLGVTEIGPVTSAQRKNKTGLLHRTAKGVVPKGSARVLLTLNMVRTDGAFNDGYADDLSLKLGNRRSNRQPQFRLEADHGGDD